MKYGMLVEADRCVGCYNCYLACRDEHCGVDHLPVAAAQSHSAGGWIRIQESERGSFPKTKISYVAVPCQQCEDAPCLAAAGDSAYRRPDGIVIFDPVKAVGMRALVEACPYGAVTWNEEKQLPQKCTFCAHLLDEGWKEPRCVEACPVAALVFGDLDDPDSVVSKRAAEKNASDLRPGSNNSTAVRYSGLPHRFIAGEVCFADRPDEPASGVTVILQRGSQQHATTTDGFGDFEFAALDESSDYLVKVSQQGYGSVERRAAPGSDPNIGTIVLERIA